MNQGEIPTLTKWLMLIAALISLPILACNFVVGVVVFALLWVTVDAINNTLVK